MFNFWPISARRSNVQDNLRRYQTPLFGLLWLGGSPECGATSPGTTPNRPESSGMEVSQARLDQDLARDALTKARATIHSFKTELVEQDIREGLKLAARNLQAGQSALAERDYRRKGLGTG
jgi:hypothetical protein